MVDTFSGIQLIFMWSWQSAVGKGVDSIESLVSVSIADIVLEII